MKDLDLNVVGLSMFMHMHVCLTEFSWCCYRVGVHMMAWQDTLASHEQGVSTRLGKAWSRLE